MIETMLFFVLCVVWYGVGFLLLQSWWRKHSDVKLDDLAFLLFISFLGPFTVIFHIYSWLDSMSMDKVVMRKKK